MKIYYLCTFWGCENLSAKEFLNQVVTNGYEGVEINFPDDDFFVSEFLTELQNIRNTINKDFIFVAQQVLSNKIETVGDYILRMTAQLEFLIELKPNFINSHTGKDFFDFSDNSKIIETAEQISKKYKIQI